MMAISTKLALLVLVLPLSILIIGDIVGFLIFGVLYIEVIAIFTSNWVFLLVWERLRESLATKLEYLNENVFLGLYAELERGELVRKQEGIEKAKNDLQRHGKFMVIALYPKNLPKKLSAFLQLHNSFYEQLEQLLSIAEKELGREPNRWELLTHLGFGIYYSPSPHEALVYTTIAISMQKEHSRLIDEAKAKLEKVKTERQAIFGELEEFLKQNNLRLTLKLVSGY